MNLVDRFRRLLERRWVLVSLAATIGLVSIFLLSVTVRSDYIDYLVYPKQKGDSIYPELRYTFFDVGLLLWCVDGLVVSGLAVLSALANRITSVWFYRTLAIYFALFIALILGGILMLVARSQGLCPPDELFQRAEFLMFADVISSAMARSRLAHSSRRAISDRMISLAYRSGHHGHQPRTSAQRTHHEHFA
jgi:hypothetical protein